MIAVFNFEVFSNILFLISFVAFFWVSCVAYNDLVPGNIRGGLDTKVYF